MGSALLLAGCASYSPHQTAVPTAKGVTRHSVAADALLVDRGFGAELLGIPEYGISHGVAPHSDFGARVYPLGAELYARQRVLAAEASRVSVMPLLAVSQVSATNADTSFIDVTSGAALLAGADLGRNLRLTVGLRCQGRLGLNAVAVREDFSAARWALLTGGSLNLEWQLNPELPMNPGIVVLWPYDIEHKRWEFPILQGGAAVTW